MMYMHYCKSCSRLHMLNGHKIVCPSCSGKLTELKLSYLSFVDMDNLAREALRQKCGTDTGIAELATTYRMFKYSKWFKEKSASESGSNLLV